jgi:hypothetical protein
VIYFNDSDHTKNLVRRIESTAGRWRRDAWRCDRDDSGTVVRSMFDRQARQSLLQLFHTGSGDASVPGKQVGEVRRGLQVHEPSVSDLRAVFAIEDSVSMTEVT